MDNVARRSRIAERFLIDTGRRHMGIVAPASSHSVEKRSTETGRYHRGRIAPGSSHGLVETFHGALAQQRRWHNDVRNGE